MNSKERDRIRKMRKDSEDKVKTGKGKHTPDYYTGWVDALQWVLMEV